MSSRLRLGMVGGGRDSFIGAVHRTAAVMDGVFELVAGALSSTPERALASGAKIGLAPERNYGTWRDMLDGELARPEHDRIDAVAVVTPNHTHFEVANAFAASGIHVICDKPLVHSSAEAATLTATARHAGVVFAVTYNYTGYPLVKQARHMVHSGMLGEVRKVVVEYHQGWLTEPIEAQGHKQAEWRTDPARSGIAGAIGDIGTHAENLMSTVTGLELEAVCSDLTAFVAGRALDDDGNALLRFTSGAKGVLMASQVSTGEENDLRLRVAGTEGSLAWRQEEPNVLVFRPHRGPIQVLRPGQSYLCPEALRASRLPPGHPEAFIEAFANVYAAAGEAICASRDGRPSDPALAHYPSVVDGARGVAFIEAMVESSRSDAKWVPMRWKGGAPAV